MGSTLDIEILDSPCGDLNFKTSPFGGRAKPPHIYSNSNNGCSDVIPMSSLFNGNVSIIKPRRGNNLKRLMRSIP